MDRQGGCKAPPGSPKFMLHAFFDVDMACSRPERVTHNSNLKKHKPPSLNPWKTVVATPKPLARKKNLSAKSREKNQLSLMIMIWYGDWFEITNDADDTNQYESESNRIIEYE